MPVLKQKVLKHKILFNLYLSFMCVRCSLVHILPFQYKKLYNTYKTLQCMKYLLFSCFIRYLKSKTFYAVVTKTLYIRYQKKYLFFFVGKGQKLICMLLIKAIFCSLLNFWKPVMSDYRLYYR